MIQENSCNVIAQRLQNLEQHNANPELQILALACCSKDIVGWFNDWVWTYDPRLNVSTIPMILFPRQAEFLLWLEERERLKEDGIGEKSRDMGFTWLCAGFLVHHWLFRQGFKAGIGSRKQKLVDELGDPDSIFEKIRIILRNLPGWMLPVGFNWKIHDNFCKLINPLNGSTITGEAGDEIGRGGRNSVYFVDEAAFLPRAELVDRALSANTNVRVWISTPNGNGNLFARKRFSGNVAVFTMHWKDDPRKNAWKLYRKGELIDEGPGGSSPPSDIPKECILIYPWYEDEKKRLQDPVSVAQELDIDYTASVEGIIIPANWVRAAVDLCKRVHFPDSSDVVAGLDVADGGNAESVLTIRRGPVVTKIYARKEGGTTDTANWALNTATTAGANLLNYDAIGVGAGIAGTFEVRKRDDDLGLIDVGINVGETPTDALWPNGKTSKEWFVNLKAEAWWMLRTRFERTYEYVELGVEYDLEDLISIPDEPKLISQLSNVLHNRTETGKIMAEKKDQLKKRGVASPDWAESLMLSFIPERTTEPQRVAPTTILTARTR